MRLLRPTLLLIWTIIAFSMISGSVQQERFLLPPQPAEAAAEESTTTEQPTTSESRGTGAPTTAETTTSSSPATEPPSPSTTTATEPAPEPTGAPRLVADAIGVDTPLSVGSFLNAQGNIEPPFQTAALYDGGSMPGQLGSTLVVAHVSSRAYGPDVFFNLGALQPGNEIYASDGVNTFTYSVAEVRVQDKPEFPWWELESVTDRSVLWLVTCGGSFDYSTGHFVSNIIVRAELVP